MRKQTYTNQPTDDVLEIIEGIVKIKREGRFEEANKKYMELSIKEKDDKHNYPYILKSWAKVLVCLGKYETAIEYFDNAAELFNNSGNKTDEWQCRDQSKKIRKRDEYRDEFIDYVRGVSGGQIEYPLNYNGNDVFDYISLGIQNAKNGNHEKAIANFNKAIEKKPEYAEAYYNVGLSYCYLGNYNQAISYFYKALDIDPDTTEVYHFLSFAYDQMGNQKKAIYCREMIDKINRKIAVETLERFL